MREAAPRPSLILPDANLFVAAIRGGGRVTDSRRLLVHLLEDEALRLVGDAPLVAEISKYAEVFRSPPVARLEAALLSRLEVVEPEEAFLRACEPYFPANKMADAFHAAVCLQTGSTIISDDHDFDKVADAGLVRRLTIAEAVRLLL